MEVKETYLKDCYVISPILHKDNRGVFFESFNHREFEKAIDGNIDFVQDNHSVSKKGTLRGLHFQTGKFAQAKLVRVVQGKVLDVVIDIRPDSKTFGKHFSIILDAKEHKQLFIPKGFAHGFLVLENDTIFSYKCDNYYKKESEGGIIFNDKTLKVNWNFPLENLIISEKDKHLPSFKSIFKI